MVQKIAQRTLPVFILLGIIGGNYAAFAQQPTNREEIVLTTYYPVPYGDYQNLRLWPSAQKECNENKRGTLYYDTDQNKVMVCTLSSDNVTYEWQVLGENLWSKNKDANTVYANNTALNSGNLNAGIGTDIARAYANRQTKLDVGDNARGNADGYVAVDDVYLKDPVSGQPGWLSQTGGDLAAPVNGQCPAGYTRYDLGTTTATGPSCSYSQQGTDPGGIGCLWTSCPTSTTFICVNNNKLGAETGAVGSKQCWYGI